MLEGSRSRRSRASFQTVHRWSLALLTVFAATGCAAPLAPETATRGAVAPDDFELVWEQSLRALRKLGLQPDRQDRANRTIVTTPETSGQWFEWWRSDVADEYAMTESSLQTVRRQVRVEFGKPAQSGGPINVDVKVQVFRLDRPERQVTTASSAFNIFSARVPTAEGEPPEGGASAVQWVALGRDVAMEQRILDRILLACGGAVAIEPSASPVVPGKPAQVSSAHDPNVPKCHRAWCTFGGVAVVG